MKAVKDGWHRVYDFSVLVEGGEITHILGDDREGYRVKVYPYWKDGNGYIMASLHHMTLDEFRGYVRRGTIYLRP